VKRGAWHYLKPAVMILFSLAVLYILSIGPVFWALNHFTLSRNRVETLSYFYGPLVKQMRDQTVFGKALDAYTSFWE
jgi:hypothetical protein